MSKKQLKRIEKKLDLLLELNGATEAQLKTVNPSPPPPKPKDEEEDDDNGN